MSLFICYLSCCVVLYHRGWGCQAEIGRVRFELTVHYAGNYKSPAALHRSTPSCIWSFTAPRTVQPQVASVRFIWTTAKTYIIIRIVFLCKMHYSIFLFVVKHPRKGSNLHNPITVLCLEDRADTGASRNCGIPIYYRRRFRLCQANHVYVAQN